MSATQRTKLADLATEVLAHILRYGSVHPIIKLWTTGDRRLRQRMAHGGVAELELIDRVPWSRSKWPFVLQELRMLSCLQIDCGNTLLGNAKPLRKALLALPPTLEQLTLCFQSSAAMLMLPDALVVSDASRFINASADTELQKMWGRPRTVPEAWKRHASYENKTAFWPIAEAFPALTHLRLQGNGITTFVRDVDFVSLPRSLLCFEIDGIILFPDPQSRWGTRLLTLPRRLERFWVWPVEPVNTTGPAPPFFKSMAWTTEQLRALPQGLLEMATLRLTLPLAGHLPRTIQKLAITMPIANEDALPPALDSITFYNMDITWSPSPLPCLNLRELRIDTAITAILGPEFVSSLPRSLVKLHLMSELDWPKLFDTEIWPESLTALHTSRFAADNAHRLPRSLLHHSTRVISALNNRIDSFSDLPPKIKSLCWHADNQTQLQLCKMTKEAIQTAPKSLLTFEFTGELVHAVECASSLPGSLTSLHLSFTLGEDNKLDASALPRGLTKLKVEKVVPTNWPGLPASLSSLHLCTPFDISVRLSQALCAGLPASLTELTLVGFTLSAADCSFLPRSLLRLSGCEIDLRPLQIPTLLPPYLQELACVLHPPTGPVTLDYKRQLLASLPKSLFLIEFGPSSIGVALNTMLYRDTVQANTAVDQPEPIFSCSLM